MSGTEVRIANAADLASLNALLPMRGMPDGHDQRFQVQQEKSGFYLAAWQGTAPVGYVLLHFTHPTHHASHTHFPHCAYVEGLFVPPSSRRAGIAFALMQACETLAAQHRANEIGLSVGLEEAPARALYQKLAYRRTEVPPFQVTWSYLDENGARQEEGELCDFWLKALS